MDIDKIQTLLVKQQNPNESGAISLLTILRYFGMSATLDHMLTACETSEAGTSLQNLENGAHTFGLAAGSFKGNFKLFEEHELPVILRLVSRETLQFYFAVCFGLSDGKFVVASPISGNVELMTKVELNEVWVAKHCLIVDRSE